MNSDDYIYAFVLGALLTAIFMMLVYISLHQTEWIMANREACITSCKGLLANGTLTGCYC
jgi:hypothetical protein